MNDRTAPLVSSTPAAPLPSTLRAPQQPSRALLADARIERDVQIELAALLADLRVCVVNYVYRRRAEGAPVERVLPEVRCLVREAESCEQWSDPEDTLLAHAVRWGLEAYHDQTAPSSVRGRA
jgi:hypothetical protein